MTGIERLRELAGGINPRSVWSVTRDEYDNAHGLDVEHKGGQLCDFLADIADQIEREQRRDPAADVSVSAYDLLPPVEREAIAWVREHGGIEKVKLDALCWNTAENIAQTTLDWLARVCPVAGIDEKCGYGVAIERLEEAINRRLMPEGMEWLLDVWPKWSNGEYCKFGDWWKSDKYGKSEPQRFSKLSIYTPEQLREWGQDDGDNYGYEWDFMRPSDPKYRPDKSEPPTPKVLDADGVEIRVMDTVYLLPGDWCDEFPCLGYHGGEKLVVFSLHADHVRGGIGCRDTRSPKDICYPQPSQLTHRAPVLAADGRPLREGETVWVTRDRPCDAPLDKGDEVTVRHAYPKTVSVKDETGDQWIVHADHLTHECPDSWERLEKDANAAVCIYFGASVKDCENCDHNSWKCSYDKSRDLVRRARALAGDA